MENVKDYIIDNSTSDFANVIEIILNDEKINDCLKMLNDYDEYTFIHSINVAKLCLEIGVDANLKQNEIINLVCAALLHDMGKCMIDENIINKTDKLSKEEYEIVKQHPVLGKQIINNIGSLNQTVLDTVLHHHENWNGTGYPLGLCENEISLYASILHVCDVYDALTSKRSYKKAFSIEESTEIIKNNSGKMFDPFVVNIFLEYIEKIKDQNECRKKI